ncbi:conjugal transfer protein TraI [Pedobacter sp. Du54]|uniref:conjugal transfer protein TraI n=1 Tax=Pedobacter anseongensis TaxID=3133439 RepID=UPI0030B3198D
MRIKEPIGVWPYIGAIKKFMKKYMVMLPMSAMTLFVALPKNADAQIAVVEVIKAGVKKVIKAVDLKVQRLQNETIWLQNAQKVLENQLSKLKLTEIADWTEKQKQLYSEYYTELWKVKSAIAYYKKLKELTTKQVSIIDEYKWAWNLFQKDKHFKAEELEHMQKIYSGMLDESLKNVDQILLVVNSFKTQMSDGERLELIGKASAQMDSNYSDLKEFNRQNIALSIQRSRSLDEAAKLKEIYGVQ